MKVRVDKGHTPTENGEISYWLWCPACDSAVRIGDTWSFNGDVDKPTFFPSIRTETDHDNVCHSFLTDGIWNFLTDSTHEFAGKSIPMVDLPDWLAKEV